MDPAADGASEEPQSALQSRRPLGDIAGIHRQRVRLARENGETSRGTPFAVQARLRLDRRNSAAPSDEMHERVVRGSLYLLHLDHEVGFKYELSFL